MILIIQNQLPHYRREFFNELAKHHDVVVMHSGSSSLDDRSKYKELLVDDKRIGPFVWQIGVIKHIRKLRPSAVIASADIRNIHSLLAMLLFDSTLLWIWWGMDRGSNNLAFWIKRLIASRDNPIIFYNDQILKYFLNYGLDIRKLFIANNTFHVPGSKCLANYPSKDIFLNVGSLDSRKKNDYLIRAFNEVRRRTGRDLYLYLIGEGVDRSNLESIILELKLTERVLLLGRIEDTSLLESYYSRAIASVSFGQAGLAVLQSMSFGVPFITERNAITGGEKFNILDGVNGLLCNDDVSSLADAMCNLVLNPKLAKNLGLEAFKHYNENASVSNMVEGFNAAINFK